MQIVDFFESTVLSKRIYFQILSPQNSIYSKTEKSLPVLYLLHGLFGEAKNWTELTEISTLIENLPFAAVMFDAGNSWYTNGIEGGRARYESFFIGEFIPRIESEYKLGGGRKNRAIAGLSMGGYGALKFALKYPSLFNWAGSMSGAFEAPQQTDARPGADWEILGDSIKAVFGEISNSELRIKNDLFQIISEMRKDDPEKPPEIYFDCGIDDSFIQINRKLFKRFSEKNVICTFREMPGGHDWIYWNRQLKEILQLVKKVFNYNP